MAKSTTIELVREFISSKRIAVIGVSRADKDFSRIVFRELVSRGYDVVPVTPAVSSVEGRKCYPRVQDVQPPVAGALLLTSPGQTDAVVRDCIEAGVQLVWMHRGQGRGAATATAIELCRASGIEVVTDLCPFMVLPGTSWPHRLHGFFRRRALLRAAS